MDLGEFGPFVCTRNSIYYAALKAVVFTLWNAIDDEEALTVIDCERKLLQAGYKVPTHWTGDQQSFMRLFENVNPKRFEGQETFQHLYLAAKQREEDNDYVAQVVLGDPRRKKRTI